MKRLHHERKRNRQTKTTCTHLVKLGLVHVDGKGGNGKLFYKVNAEKFST